MADATQKSKIKKIYNVISTVILTVVFLFLVVVVVASVMQKKQGSDVKLFGHYMYTVLTDSMSPTIEPGETIWCKVAEKDDIVEGAIITFIAPSGPLKGRNETHRIFKIEYDANGEKIITTKGDHSSSPDDWTIKESDVKAVYQKTLPVLSGLVSFMRKQPFLSYILLIALPILLVCVMFIVGYVKDRAKEIDEENKANKKTISMSDLSEEERQKLISEFSGETSDENTMNETKNDVAESVENDEKKAQNADFESPSDNENIDEKSE